MEAGETGPLELATKALAWFRDRAQIDQSADRVLGHKKGNSLNHWVLSHRTRESISATELLLGEQLDAVLVSHFFDKGNRFRNGLKDGVATHLALRVEKALRGLLVFC